MEEEQREHADSRIAVRVQGFAGAAQPEVMRAAEKDEQYVSLVCDACHEAFRHAFGMRMAVPYQNETKLAGRVLYYLLTTGSGLQTLGEEYCDISQVVRDSRLPATPARRMVLVFFQTVLPYLTERLSARAAARGVSLAMQEELQSVRGNNLGGISSETNADRGYMGAESSMAGENRAMAGSSDRRHGFSRALLVQRMRQGWNTVLQRWSAVLPSLREDLSLVVRAHLMLFLL